MTHHLNESWLKQWGHHRATVSRIALNLPGVDPIEYTIGYRHGARCGLLDPDSPPNFLRGYRDGLRWFLDEFEP